MFGFTTFSGAPFSSLSGAVFAASISETATATEAVSSIGIFLSAVSETGTATDAVSSPDF